MRIIGFMFGAGAEISYGLPSGGDFALNLFRQDPAESKKIFKNQRDAIDATKRYAQWLPDDYRTRNVSAFGKKAYEDIIRCTVEQSRDKIIERLNHVDQIALKIVAMLKSQECLDVDNAFWEINRQLVADSYMNQTIKFVKEFDEGEDLFKSNYFSSLLMVYKNRNHLDSSLVSEVSKIIIAILQLQLGALGEKLSRKINDGVFERKDDDIDILDDLGDIIQLNYQAVGMTGLEYLLDIKKPDTGKSIGIVLYFAQRLIERIYSCVLDYKSLIDSYWMYLYHPKNEWSKFCKISIFLLSTQQYIKAQYDAKMIGKDGYYKDLKSAVVSNKLTISAVGTSNYSPLISNVLDGTSITYLNGSTELLYDPYLNRIGCEHDFQNEDNHFLVPLMFTQSGTKPMISIDMSTKYVEYYEKLKQSDEICVIGFGFNSDDEHINGLFRDLVDRQEKTMTLIDLEGTEEPKTVKLRIAQQLKIKNTDRISVMLVDQSRKCSGVNWLDYLLEKGINNR